SAALRRHRVSREAHRSGRADHSADGRSGTFAARTPARGRAGVSQRDRARAARSARVREPRPHLSARGPLRPRGVRAGAGAPARFLRLMEVTAPYQAALAEVDGIEGPLVGRPVLAFSPQSLITMRGLASASASGPIHFTDVTGESGLPDRGAPVTALAWGDYDGDGEDNLLVAAPEPRLYAVHGGFVAEVSAKTPLPIPAGAVVATFVDYDNDGWLDLF